MISNTSGKNSKRWTPMIGLRNSIICGTIAAIILSLLLALIANSTPPTLIFNFYLRVALSFVIAWILFSIIHASAGMTSSIYTAWAIILSAAVMVSNHFAMAYPLLDTPSLTEGTGERFADARWLDLGFIFITNIPCYLGIGFCALLSNNGVPGPDFASRFLTQPLYGRTR